MSMYEVLQANKRMQEEERKRKEREPYEEIIRRLKKQDRERAMLEQSSSDGKL